MRTQRVNMASKPSSAHGSSALRGLGGRLRERRLAAGITARELARQLGVSPSFVSQFENGKSQPSVGTLYAISKFLEVSVDALFDPTYDAGSDAQVGTAKSATELDTGSRPRGAVAGGAFQASGESRSPTEGSEPPREPCRFSITRPSERRTLVLDTGVTWAQLAASGDGDCEFMEIMYPPGSSSARDDRMMRHAGLEYGHLVEGELQVTVGFDVYTMCAGDSLCLDSSRPHLFRNLGTSPARGIWFVQHAHVTN